MPYSARLLLQRFLTIKSHLEYPKISSSGSPFSTDMPPLVILDRDGVINHERADFVRSPAEWQPLAGSLDAIARLTRAGFQIAVATNQSGVARGYYNLATLELIHAKMRQMIEIAGGHIDALFYCPHHEADACTCRKPKTGMLEAIAQHFDISLVGVPAVGDMLRDLTAYASMGCQPILVLTGHGKTTLLAAQHAPLPSNTWICEDLTAVAERLLEHK